MVGIEKLRHHQAWLQGAKVSKLLTTQDNFFYFFILVIDRNIKTECYHSFLLYLLCLCSNLMSIQRGHHF